MKLRSLFFEHEDDGYIGISFYPDVGKIILHYPYDNEYCYYLITDTEFYDPAVVLTENDLKG